MHEARARKMSDMIIRASKVLVSYIQESVK